MEKNELCAIEVVYAPNREQQTHCTLLVTADCTLQQAIVQSGILQKCPDIDLNHNKIGLFGQLVTLTTLVKNGDRIEIYRPLKVDPKEARRRRAGPRKKSVSSF